MHQKTIILDLNFKHEEETKRQNNDWLRAKCKLRKISAFLLLYSVLVKSIFDCRVTNSEFLVLVNMQVYSFKVATLAVLFYENRHLILFYPSTWAMSCTNV